MPTVAAAYILTSGRLDGSIIAPTITCQATRNSRRAGPKPGPPTSSESWCSAPAEPVASAAIAATQAAPIPISTGRRDAAQRPGGGRDGDG